MLPYEVTKPQWVNSAPFTNSVHLSELSKHCLAVLYHIHIWQVSPQLWWHLANKNVIQHIQYVYTYGKAKMSLVETLMNRCLSINLHIRAIFMKGALLGWIIVDFQLKSTAHYTILYVKYSLTVFFNLHISARSHYDNPQWLNHKTYRPCTYQETLLTRNISKPFHI